MLGFFNGTETERSPSLCVLPRTNYVDAGPLSRGYNLIRAVAMPLDLEDDDCADGTRLVTAVDSITWRYGKSTVHVASTGAMDQVREWGMR